MNDIAHNDVLVHILERLDPEARLLHAEPLTGGVSAQMTMLEISCGDGPTRKLVLRRHSTGNLAQNPQVTAIEHRLLTTLRAAGLPVPAPLALDISTEILPVPYLILEYVTGSPAFEPVEVPDLVTKLATALASIHAVDLDHHDLSFLPMQDNGFGPRPEVLDESLDEGRIRETMERCWPLSPRNVPVLLHGDLWPGNMLWHEGQLTAIIDWEDARLGDPVVDLAKSRLETLWAFGPEGMRRFTAHYMTLMPHVDISDLPYWDLAAALEPAGDLGDWGLPPEKEQRFRRLHHDFVTRAIRNLR